MTAMGPGQQTSVPDWLRPLATALPTLEPTDFSAFLAPADASPREAAVLILFGDMAAGRSILLLERSHDMRSHPGQMAFPGGTRDPGDTDATAAALREAEEETGLDPTGVEVVGSLPRLWLPPSNFEVTPVLGWWRTPSPVRAVDPAETASVHTLTLDELLDPAHRATIRHPSGYLGPAFFVRDLVVWGFTANLLSRLFVIAGWERVWDPSRELDLPPELAAGSSPARWRSGVQP